VLGERRIIDDEVRGEKHYSVHNTRLQAEAEAHERMTRADLNEAHRISLTSRKRLKI
jgi:hypothetical protein